MDVATAITKVARNVGMLTGDGMSPYSDPQIQNQLSNAHDKIIADFVWPELDAIAIKTLDGTTGKITVAFSASDGLYDYKQIKRIWVKGVLRELPVISGVVNPLLQSSLNGYSILNIKDDPNKVYFFKVYPITISNDCAIEYTLKADFSVPTTVVPVDDLLHIYLASWMYAVDDGTNPAQAEKYFNLYEDRIKSLRANVNRGPMALNPFNGPLEQWWTADGSS